MQRDPDLACILNNTGHPGPAGRRQYLSNLGLLTSEWYSLWTQVTLFYATFFFPPLIGTYCAFLWRYENFNSCRNTLFSAPVSYQTIYVSNYPGLSHDLTDTAVVCSPVVAAGKAVGLMGLPSVHIVTWIIRGMAGALVIAALQFFLAAQVQSFATPVAMGAAGGVAGLLAANSRAGLFFPLLPRCFWV